MVAGLDQIEKGQEKKHNYSASDVDAEDNVNIDLGGKAEFESQSEISKQNIHI